MTEASAARWREDPFHPMAGPRGHVAFPLVLSFDVEEHYRIEAGAGMDLGPDWHTHCRERVDVSTRWLLEALARADVRATFFIVGEIARHLPGLVRDVARAGHEVASHGWDHRRVHSFTPASFREDVRRSQEALEDVTGQPVVGYRAPTFSVVRQTAWALDVLAELGLAYDSSIYPVRHDRYGVPAAPRCPFLARGERHTILELPPATLRLFGVNLPMGGGGYFRLFPLFLTEQAIRQTAQGATPAGVMLYFHPWEFDTEQRQLPLGRVSRFRTYVGTGQTRRRLNTLLGKYTFIRAIDLVRQIEPSRGQLPFYSLSDAPNPRFGEKFLQTNTPS